MNSHVRPTAFTIISKNPKFSEMKFAVDRYSPKGGWLGTEYFRTLDEARDFNKAMKEKERKKNKANERLSP